MSPSFIFARPLIVACDLNAVSFDFADQLIIYHEICAAIMWSVALIAVPAYLGEIGLYTDFSERMNTMIEKKPWTGFLPPFRLWGNCYFVGSLRASVHIVDTGAGLVMLDCGYQESLYLVIEHMHRLGLDPARLTALFITHGHIDHCAAAAALRQLTGCRIYLGAADADAVQGTAATDLTYASELGMPFINFTPDVLLNDGDEVTIGSTTFRAIASPGHTVGTMSYCFDLQDGERTMRALLQGGAGTNTLTRDYLDRHQCSDSLRDEFAASMAALCTMRADIFLGNHATQNDTAGKAARLTAGETDAFVDPGEAARFGKAILRKLRRLIEEETASG